MFPGLTFDNEVVLLLLRERKFTENKVVDKTLGISKLKILYLYSELAGYQIAVFSSFVNDYDSEVHVISWDRNRLKPFVPDKIDGVQFYQRSKYNNVELLELSKTINPDIVYISGWMDKGYLYVARYFRRHNVKVVTGFDDKWNGSLRQRIGAFIFPFVFRRYFSHAWVAGPYQFEFAKRLGFKNSDIIFDLLTANTNVFQTITAPDRTPHQVPKAFLYVGNFRKVKGVDILAEAFKIYKSKFQGDWNLICVGNGDLESALTEDQRIEVISFADENKLIEISKRAGIFILPSRNDQWGVVVHEFTSLGKPLLLSENVGAKATFFIEGFNGLLFRNNSPEHLAEKMAEFSGLENERLIEMGGNSIILSKRINVRTAAANFMSLLYK